MLEPYFLILLIVLFVLVSAMIIIKLVKLPKAQPEEITLPQFLGPPLPEITAEQEEVKKIVTDKKEFTEEDIAKMNIELKKIFGEDAFISLEDFMDSSSQSQVIPFTAADNYSDVKYEIKTHEISAEAWNDLDYIEQLLSYHNQGYEFEGLEQIYRKASQGAGISKEERKKLEQWYVLVSLEKVYNV